MRAGPLALPPTLPIDARYFETARLTITYMLQPFQKKNKKKGLTC
jgi:hypothetical protein